MTHAAMEARAIPLSPDDDAMRRVAAGDATALAALFERHRHRLFGFLCHLVGDPATAEDLLGETFLRVYQARTRYRAGGFLPWLFRIARNLAVGELRRRGAQHRACERLSREPESGSDWDAGRVDARERVQAALQTLPEEQRAALVLREYLEMDYREIAQVLGCSEEAARARTYRGRSALREALRGWWEASAASE
jgi:RNA polymerase sigma-70 factor (ECF subfamily)